ncbi:MAG: SRPBCC family protein [Planctomycetota bacterium]
MKSIASVEINRPIEEVFDYTNAKVAEWSLTVVEDEIIEDKGGLGDRSRCVTEENGRQMVFDGTTTVWEPPHRSVVSLIGKSFDIEAEYRFENISGKTRVTQEAIVSGKGLFRIMFMILGRLMQKQGCQAAQKELDSLKLKLEEGAGLPNA